jgi:three-Cys-motif partner protein
MVMDLNQNILWRNPDEVSESQSVRMTQFWGDDSWRDIAYDRIPTLFNDEVLQKNSNQTILMAYIERLRMKAGFKFVATPIAMKNSMGAVIYYLIFASNNSIGNKIANSILRKYRSQGIQFGL